MIAKNIWKSERERRRNRKLGKRERKKKTERGGKDKMKV
jgi:hypothetical protein